MYNLILITNILRILDEKDMTKSELADKAGVSHSFFTDLTNDQTHPSLWILKAGSTKHQHHHSHYFICFGIWAAAIFKTYTINT